MFYAYFFNIFLILPLQSSFLCVIINLISAVFEKEVTRMRENLHPNYKKTTISCACGNVIETASTKENIKVEICSKCHPFFTGKQKLVDTGGRVDRFKRRFSNKKD
jgi:large subunit ribosomal protein L31